MTRNSRAITRRQLLARVGYAGGGSAMYRCMSALGLLATSSGCEGDLPAPGSGDGSEVIILGAGVAGLTAAYQLGEAGYSCAVLEARMRAGGRNETIRAGDVVDEMASTQRCTFSDDPQLYFNTGPARIPHHHRAVLDYCREFAIPLEVFVNDNRAAVMRHAAARGGNAIPGRVVHSDTRGFIASLLAKAVNRGALDDEVSTEDKAKLLDMLVEFGDLDEDYFYAGTSRAGYVDQVNPGLAPGDLEDRLDMTELLNADFWRFKLHYNHFINQAPTLLQPVGGMDMIPKAFVERIGDIIEYGAEVTQIRKVQNGVRIIYIDASGVERAVQGDYALVTIPPWLLRDIDSDISPEYQQAIAAIPQVRAAKVAFESRRFWEVDLGIYGGISWTDEDITQIWYPSGGIHSERGILVGAYIWGRQSAVEFAALSPEDRLAMAIEQGNRIHPGYGSEVTNGISRSWLNTPYSRGSWSAAPPPQILLEPDGRIFFAGEHLSYLQGWQEGSILTAQHAVMRLHEMAQSR
ncbi:MAG: flavin monoamine oxidase family protein [Proteobacteria bacterium]|nr:flavin monoamine oxidase family protein [Pseudomonadota bacterium]